MYSLSVWELRHRVGFDLRWTPQPRIQRRHFQGHEDRETAIVGPKSRDVLPSERSRPVAIHVISASRPGSGQPHQMAIGLPRHGGLSAGLLDQCNLAGDVSQSGMGGAVRQVVIEGLIEPASQWPRGFRHVFVFRRRSLFRRSPPRCWRAPPRLRRHRGRRPAPCRAARRRPCRRVPRRRRARTRPHRTSPSSRR